MNILIVDDEAPARARLARLLADLPGRYAIAGEAADGEAALAFCRDREVDVVLLDVRMPGMDGLAVAARLATLTPPPAVILVTAFEEHALDAFERRVADYLVKPVRRERLREALERLGIPTRPQQAALLTPMRTGRRRLLSASYRGDVRSVPVEDVIYLQAEHKYVTVRHLAGELLLEESLRSLEEEFPDLFLRVHRNALAAVRYVSGIAKAPDGAWLVCLRACEVRLSISRRHLPEVRRCLKTGTFEGTAAAMKEMA